MTTLNHCTVLYVLVFLLVPTVVLLVWTLAQFCSKSGLDWLSGATATVVDLNMGPEPGALGMREQGRE